MGCTCSVYDCNQNTTDLDYLVVRGGKDCLEAERSIMIVRYDFHIHQVHCPTGSDNALELVIFNNANMMLIYEEVTPTRKRL